MDEKAELIKVKGMEKADELRQKIADIISGKLRAEFMDLDEAIVLWASLPKERHGELEDVFHKFANSIDGDKPTSYNQWWMFFADAPLGSYEKQIAVLMMARTSKIYADWLVTWMAAEDYPLVLKQIIAREMMACAETKRQLEEAKEAMKEAGLAETEEK